MELSKSAPPNAVACVTKVTGTETRDACDNYHLACKYKQHESPGMQIASR